MTDTERWRCWEFVRGMDASMCATCRHYYLHYIRFSDGRFEPIHDGHCVHQRRIKNRKPYDICEHYTRDETKGG